MLFLSSREFAKEIGVHYNTLRRWEQKGLIEPHHLTPSGYRQYALSQVKDVLKLTNAEFKAKYKDKLKENK